MMDPIAAEHIRRNVEARDRWQDFCSHRREVTKHLTRGFGADAGRLCVLGAGNSNDLDLAALTAIYQEVHLVDLDAEALSWGVEWQKPANRDRIVLHGGVDVSGILDLMNREEFAASSDARTIRECVLRATTCSPPSLAGPFDTVASVGLLSQLIDSVVMAAPEDHSGFMDLLLAVRTRHLRLLAELSAPRGWGLLVSDFVSSQTCPELAALSPDELPHRLRNLVAERNFFHGLNPFVLESLYRSDPQIAPLVDRVQLLRPWRWNLGPRTYAVCAVKFQRSSLAVP